MTDSVTLASKRHNSWFLYQNPKNRGKLLFVKAIFVEKWCNSKNVKLWVLLDNKEINEDL